MVNDPGSKFRKTTLSLAFTYFLAFEVGEQFNFHLYNAYSENAYITGLFFLRSQSDNVSKILSLPST